jgi:dephospho-CoA kinase
MLRVALTGGIATGKSYVASRLREAGVPVVDADALARDAVAPRSAGLRAVVERFGATVLDTDGTLNRPKLAAIVFGDPAARADLEAIIHPTVRAGIDAFLGALPADTPFAVADIPLLYETGRAGDFDVVVVAACPPDMQIDRIVRRDGATREQAEQRLAAQLPIGDKIRRADYVVDTSTTFEATDAAVAGVVRALGAGAGRS